MMGPDVAVLIPVYRNLLDASEEEALRQCARVLGSHPIVFVTHAAVDKGLYLRWIPNARFEEFDERFFRSIDGYNELLLSQEFYARFQKYGFILIYQTDAYVFRDELAAWCSQDYDYIGGLWVDVDPQLGITGGTAGNGGLSLRKVSSFLIITNPQYRVAGWSDLVRQYLNRRSTGWRYSVWYFLTFLPKFFGLVVPRLLGYRNTFVSICRAENVGEDRIFVQRVLSKRGWRIPPFEVALGFSWELQLEGLWQRCGRLPFGCHAWSRGDYFGENVSQFWSRHIPTGTKESVAP